MKNKTILYILDFNLSDINGSQHLQVSLIEDFLKNDFNITLIQPNKNKFKLPNNLKKFNNLKIINIEKKSYNKNNLLKRVSVSRKYFEKVIKTMVNECIEYDFIYFLSTPITHFFVNKLKKITKKPLIFHIQDLYPDTLKTTIPFMFKLIIKILNKKQNKILEHVSEIIVISKDIKEVLIKKEVEESKIHVVPNWFWNMENIKQDENRFLKKFNIKKEGFVIQYAGNFGRVIDYKAIIEFAEKLAPFKDIKIHFIGNGSKENFFRKMIKRENIKNIIFFPMQPFELVKDINSYADICFIPLKKDVIYHSVPSKASIAHALGVPSLFVLNKESKYAQEIQENEVGHVVDYNNMDSAVNFVLKLKNDKDVYKRYKKKALIYSNRLARDVNTSKIVDIFKNIENGVKKDV